MKLGTEHLTEKNCIEITDQWKLEWEKGVQVPYAKFLIKPTVFHNRNYTAADDFEGTNIFHNYIFQLLNCY